MSDTYRQQCLDEAGEEIGGFDAHERAHRVQFWGGPFRGDDELWFELTVVELGGGARWWELTRIGSRSPKRPPTFHTIEAAISEMSSDYSVEPPPWSGPE
jgi:hypothetical protein